MAKNFPKTVYVTRIIGEDGEPDEFFIDVDKKVLAERDNQDTEVGEYKLVRVGSVEKSSKIVFE